MDSEDRMKKPDWTKILSAAAFACAGVLLLLLVQRILTPEIEYPYFKDCTADMVGELAELEDSDIQVLFAGASHGLFGIDPMRIYERSGIVTYNVSSASQPLELSYYMLKYALSKQSPKVVLLDVSQLFSYKFQNPYYRYILDSMPLCSTKNELAWACAEHFTQEKRLSSYLSAFFPIIQYHDRWSELRSEDFSMAESPRNTFTKGYYLCTGQVGSDMTVEWMNDVASINAASAGRTEEIENGEARVTQDDRRVYDPEILPEEWERVLRIKALCEENGAELRLMKIPVCSAPQSTNSAWTRIKSELVRAAAAEAGIPYIDLLYDAQIGLDYTRDSIDRGVHMNFLGAKKVSDFLAGYIQTECGLTGSRCDQNYERDIPIYDKISGAAELMLTGALGPYLERLSGYDGVTVFISAADDMRSNLRQEDVAALKAFGLQTDFDAMEYSDAYLAVKEGNTVVYEASSNRKIEKGGILENGSSYAIASCGWRMGSSSEIIIDGTDYSMGRRGINIVVYDNETRLVLDSVTFDTWSSGDQSAIRDQSYSYEKCVMGCSIMEGYLLDQKQSLMLRDAGNEEYKPVEDGVYNIIPVGNSACAVDVPFGAVDENANIWLCDRNGEIPQEFEFRSIGDGLYTIRAVCSGKVLTVENNSSMPGSNVVQQGYTGVESQKWFIAWGTGKSFSLISPNTGCALDVEGGFAEPGTNIQVWTENREIPQQFFLERVG